MNYQFILNSALGVAGSAYSFAVGAWSEALNFLLIIIATDIITGVYASVAEGSGLRSSVGRTGLANKGLILLVIIVSHRADVLLGTEAIMAGAIYFYIANELLSVVENVGRAGFPLPESFRKIIAILKEKGS